MIVQTVKVVLNKDYGGFHLDTEMALWLMQNKGWTIGNHNTHDYDTTEVDLMGIDASDWFVPSKKYDEDAFRINPDFIECVETLRKKYNLESWSDEFEFKREYEGKNFSCPKVVDLKVQEISIHLHVEDVHDGKETVRTWIS